MIIGDDKPVDRTTGPSLMQHIVDVVFILFQLTRLKPCEDLLNVAFILPASLYIRSSHFIVRLMDCRWASGGWKFIKGALITICCPL